VEGSVWKDLCQLQHYLIYSKRDIYIYIYIYIYCNVRFFGFIDFSFTSKFVLVEDLLNRSLGIFFAKEKLPCFCFL
jgi:hypothetical protein